MSKPIGKVPKPKASEVCRPQAASANKIVYNLHTLGWRDFQGLCGTILREHLGQTYEIFADTDDAGRDGAFFGTWTPQAGESFHGSFVAQCKFSAQPGKTLKISDLSEEFEKIKVLARRGYASSYLLLTNTIVSAKVAADLRTIILNIEGVECFGIYGGDWFTQQIRVNKRLRTLVPRLYGLGDLTEILDERVYDQAQEILSWLGDELERFVVTDTHHKSVAALRDKGFVLLLGDAGSGKSTIAAALALAAADTWGSRLVKICSAADFKDAWNPNDPEQFFWADDTFGQRQYERDRTLDWNHYLPHLSAAVRRGARVIFTSRTYIYRDAIDDLKESIFPLLKESQVVIEVENLTQREKEQIVYNHLRLGDQSRPFRSRIKSTLSDVAGHEKFLPETARRLGLEMFTKNIRPERHSVLSFVANPEVYLVEILRGFGDANKAALGLAFMRGGRIKVPLELDDAEQYTIALMNSSLGAVRKAIHAIEGTILIRELEGGIYYYRFKHPTIRDAFGALIIEDANLMDVFLKGTRMDLLFNEVTCGDVGLEGVKLVIPPDRFHALLNRLKTHLGTPDGKSQVISFLATRCDADFLSLFLSTFKGFLRSIRPPQYILWSKEVKLFSRLKKLRLLPESTRIRFVEHVNELIARERMEWGGIRQEGIRQLFTPQELRSLRLKVSRTRNMDWFSRELKSWVEAWEQDREEDPEEYFWQLQFELNSLSSEFSRNRTLSNRYEKALGIIEQKISELKSGWRAKSGELSAAEEDESVQERSIFDDVDA